MTAMRRIDMFGLNLSRADRVAVRRVCDAGRIGPGEMVDRFEAAFRAATGFEHAAATNSGTTALLAALLVLRHYGGHGQAIAPAYGHPAGANAALTLGYGVRLADVDPATGLMDLGALERLLARCRPVVVIFVEHLGQQTQTRRVAALAGQYGAALVVDAATSLQCPEPAVRGVWTAYSFSPQKLVTTGQGGMVCAPTERDATLARQAVRNAMIRLGGTQTFCGVGLNARMTDMQAALGVSQLRRLKRLREVHSRTMRWWAEVDPGVGETHWLPAVRAIGPAQATVLMRELAANRVASARLYCPVYRNPVFDGCSVGELAGAEECYGRTVYLPQSKLMSREDVRRIGRIVRRYQESLL